MEYNILQNEIKSIPGALQKLFDIVEKIIILFMMKRALKDIQKFKQIIQFEIVLRDTPLISHNDCLSFVDIMLNVLFAKNA